MDKLKQPLGYPVAHARLVNNLCELEIPAGLKGVPRFVHRGFKVRLRSGLTKLLKWIDCGLFLRARMVLELEIIDLRSSVAVRLGRSIVAIRLGGPRHRGSGRDSADRAGR